MRFPEESVSFQSEGINCLGSPSTPETSSTDIWFTESTYPWYVIFVENSIIILKNTEFNDVILESLIGKSSFDYNETEFNLEKPSSDNKEVLQFDENYGIYEDILNELPDEDKIKVEKAE